MPHSSDLTRFRDLFPSGLVRVGIENDVGFALDVDLQTNDTDGGNVRSAPALFVGLTSTRTKATLVTTGVGAVIGLVALAYLIANPPKD